MSPATVDQDVRIASDFVLADQDPKLQKEQHVVDAQVTGRAADCRWFRHLCSRNKISKRYLDADVQMWTTKSDMPHMGLYSHSHRVLQSVVEEQNACGQTPDSKCSHNCPCEGLLRCYCYRSRGLSHPGFDQAQFEPTVCPVQRHYRC